VKVEPERPAVSRAAALPRAPRPTWRRGTAYTAPACSTWQRALGRIKAEPFIALDDPAAALQAFVTAGEATKDLAGAVLAGLALLRSANVPGWRIAAHDRLAALAGGDDAEMLRAFWAPTEDFVGLFPKLQRLALAQPHVDAAELRALSARKDAELTRETTRVLAARCWVHPLLQFETRAAAIREAAE
jgi:ParB family chromosome partitioning protein